MRSVSQGKMPVIASRIARGTVNLIALMTMVMAMEIPLANRITPLAVSLQDGQIYVATAATAMPVSSQDRGVSLPQPTPVGTLITTAMGRRRRKIHILLEVILQPRAEGSVLTLSNRGGYNLALHGSPLVE
jgi:hypothetical protein